MRLFLLLLTVLSGPALAQQINVRSGAHEAFARLVLDVPAGTAWTLEETSSGARLSLVDHDGGFDVSSVFDRIDQTFVSAVLADASGVNVEFSCNCAAKVFVQGSSMIVMDVSAAPETEPTNAENSIALEFVGQQPLRFTGGWNEDSTPSVSGIASEQKSPNSSNTNEFQAQTLRSVPIEQSRIGVQSERLQQTEEELSRQIGSAATRGILTPFAGRIIPDVSRSQSQINTRVFDSDMPKKVLDTNSDLVSGNIKISTSSDRPEKVNGNLKTTTSLGISCISPATVAVQNWSSETGFADGLADLRSQLFGEFDRLDHDVAIKVVQTYLHYGFGAEARQIITMDPALARSHPALVGIAEIMEYGHSTTSKYLENFVDCKSDVALWAILSTQSVDASSAIDVDAALLSLSGLPMHLRNFIAPELSRRLLAYGDADAASAALRSLERAKETLLPDANFAKANLEMDQGSVEQAQHRLADVVGSNAEQSAEALIKYVDSHLDADAKIDEEIATLVEAYAMEMRDSPIGDELRRTQVLALGKSGQFSKAFEALSRVRARSAERSEDALRSSVLELLTRGASDVEFLDHAFSQMAIAPETISTSARFLVAERLVGLGFYEQAEIVLVTGPETQSDSKTSLLRAEIALALSRPHEALAHLFGNTSQAANLLRAQAEMRAEDFSEAHSIYSQIGDEANSRRTAWLSDEWSVLVEEAEPVFGPVVSVAQSTLNNPPELEGMLERAAISISESENARRVIQNLLESSNADIAAN